jgi:hypothetical protein
MKVYAVLVSGLLLLSACAGKPVPQLKSDASVDRDPSSIRNVRNFWESSSLSLPLNAGSKIDQNYTVKFEHFTAYEEDKPVTRMVPTVETVWEIKSAPVLMCRSEEGRGSSPLWDEFYSAKRSEKAKALAKAIQGVGSVSASSLVEANYFNSKPRSWDDFKDEVERAANAEVITKNVRHQVLYQYRQENMSNLGYQTHVSNACTFEVERYLAPRDVVVNKPRTTIETSTIRKLIDTERETYRVRVSGQRLQSFETETIVLNFDKESGRVGLSATAYNNFSLSLNSNVINVTGIGRKSIKLPAEVLPRGATLLKGNGKASFTAPINPLYIPKTPADGYLLGSIRVTSCRIGTFGGCSLRNRDERSMPVVVKGIVPGKTTMTHEFDIQSGRRYWVNHWVNTASSPWYINNVVRSASQPEI